MAKRPSARLADFRFADAAGASRSKAAPRPHAAIDIGRFDPAAKPFSQGSKTLDRARVSALAAEIDRLQDMLWADHRYKVLVVLQGTDTSGKDGTIRGVFGDTSALGVHAVAWKAPTDDEKAHDFLWRIHQQVPASGEITIFNRSHYEDVLVPVVRGWIDAAETARRFAQINAFERLLAESGTLVLKFFLHISNEEQRLRLQQRIDDPDKHWKFALGDLDDRKQWSAFQAAYGAAIGATGTPWAPWMIVPADSKTHRNLMIATAVKEALIGLKLRYPPGDPKLAGLKVT